MKSLLKKIIAALSSKTNEIRIRIMIFFLLHKSSIDKNTSITHSLSRKLHALVAHRHHLDAKKIEDVLQHEEDGGTHLLISYNRAEGTQERYTENFINKEEEEKEEYPDLTHTLFKESEAALEEEEESPAAEEEVVAEGGGVAEVAEEEKDIDQVADLFIKRFKRQVQLQKQQSLERSSQLRLLQSAV